MDEKSFYIVRSKFFFVAQNVEKYNIQKAIVFNLSSQKINTNNILYINDIPLLFPLGNKQIFYYFQGNNLIFQHDILKSAFYLLSGYQEYGSDKKDDMGRFPYQESIQYKLGIIHKPIVNYYFEIIIEGIEAFCRKNAIPFKLETLFDNWKVMLTHDIDRVDTYSQKVLEYRVKQLIGISPSQYSKIWQVKQLIKYVFGFLTRKWNNRHWDFDIIRKYEGQFNYRSVFFFLTKEINKHDAAYDFSEARIKELMKKLDDEECEIGLHGPVRSFYDFNSMERAYLRLSDYSPQIPLGIRQHRLLYHHPKTLKIQEKLGLRYDTTLGFAGHEGFRNSYCLPFKLYDFESDRMIDIWEIPLIAMDSTLFNYRKLSTEEAKEALNNLIGEIRKFNGIFTLLWHNGFGTDHPNKEITNFYPMTLQLFYEKGGNSILGKEIIEKLEKLLQTL